MHGQPVVDLCRTFPEGGSCVLLMVQAGTQPLVAVHQHFEPGEPIPFLMAEYVANLASEVK